MKPIEGKALPATAADPHQAAPSKKQQQRQLASRRQRLLSITAGVAAVLAVIFYAWSVLAYRSSMEDRFIPPDRPADGVAVVLVPKSVDADATSVQTEVLIFPGEDLIDSDGRLLRTISLDVYPSADAGTVTFEANTTPSPEAVVIPAPGVVQRYPFDTYSLRVRVGVTAGDVTATGSNTAPLPMSLSVSFNVPGWDYTPVQAPDGFTVTRQSVEGHIARSVSTMTIAVVLITLMFVFGVLAAAVVILGVRGRFTFEMSTAAWFTSAIFALVSLRNGLPGDPPLGSWMDVLVYFWVIAVLMASITVAVTSLLIRSAGKHAGK